MWLLDYLSSRKLKVSVEQYRLLKTLRRLPNVTIVEDGTSLVILTKDSLINLKTLLVKYATNLEYKTIKLDKSNTDKLYLLELKCRLRPTAIESVVSSKDTAIINKVIYTLHFLPRDKKLYNDRGVRWVHNIYSGVIGDHQLKVYRLDGGVDVIDARESNLLSSILALIKQYIKREGKHV